MILEEIERYVQHYNVDRFPELDTEWKRLAGYQNYYRWLWAAIKVLQPKTVVELGRERGVSTIIMLDALPETSTLTSVDIVEEAVFLNSERAKRVNQITGHTLDVWEKVPDAIDFLFIDDDHTGVHVLSEWITYRPKLAPGAVVVFDDIHFNQGMTEFWESLQEEKYDISKWHEPGFGVVLI